MEQATNPASPLLPADSKKPSVLRYFTLRTVLLLVVAAVFYLLGMRGVWWIVAAFLVSGFISLFVLSRQRDDAAGNLESAFSRLNRRIDRAASAEDEMLDAQSDQNLKNGQTDKIGRNDQIAPDRAAADRPTNDGASADPGSAGSAGSSAAGPGAAGPGAAGPGAAGPGVADAGAANRAD